MQICSNHPKNPCVPLQSAARPSAGLGLLDGRALHSTLKVAVPPIRSPRGSICGCWPVTVKALWIPRSQTPETREMENVCSPWPLIRMQPPGVTAVSGPLLGGPYQSCRGLSRLYQDGIVAPRSGSVQVLEKQMAMANQPTGVVWR